MAEQKHRGPMGGGPRGMMPGEKAKDFKGTMGKLISYLGKYLPAIIAVMLFAIASTVFSIIGPKILGNATTELFNGIIAQLTGTGGIDFEAVARILLFLGIIYLVSAVLSYIQGFIMTKVSTQISYGMRRDISQKINRMPLAYFDRVPNGEVLSRITNDVDTVTQTLNQSMTQIVTSVTQFIGVHHQPADDAGCPVHPAAEPHHRQQRGQAQPALFPKAAGLSGPRQRTRGGDVWRSSGGNGLQR